MTEDISVICDIDPSVIERYRQSFYQALGGELREHAMMIPCAFAIMLAEPIGPTAVKFNVIIGSVKELLPKGADEAATMLERNLREWERKNYPDIIQIHGTVGTA